MFVFAKHKTHKMQLRVYEGREFPLSGATNASQSLSKEILLIFLRRKNAFVYIILQLGANAQNATTVITIVNVYIALTLCQGQSSLLYLSHSILAPSLGGEYYSYPPSNRCGD